jgi:hypothetical protein
MARTEMNISANFLAAASAAIHTKFRYVQHLHHYLLQLKCRHVNLTDYESVSEPFRVLLSLLQDVGVVRYRMTAAHIAARDCRHSE